MKNLNSTRSLNKPHVSASGGFTILELIVVVGLVAVLAGILLPALSKARSRAQAIICMNNTRQLWSAWHLYADDNNGRLAYNLGGQSSSLSSPLRTHNNWVNSYLTWDLFPDNTNTLTITEGGLGLYTARSSKLYRCPSDDVLSRSQQNAGWTERVRSYSMNAMVGDAGDISKTGSNTNNPSYSQFFSVSKIPEPSSIFIFLDEHPDSINDGYFINRAYTYKWESLPASYHNGAAAVVFADGHSELHPWMNASTKRPAEPDAAGLPFSIAPASGQSSRTQTADYDWVIRHMSVHKNASFGD